MHHDLFLNYRSIMLVDRSKAFEVASRQKVTTELVNNDDKIVP